MAGKERGKKGYEDDDPKMVRWKQIKKWRTKREERGEIKTGTQSRGGSTTPRIENTCNSMCRTSFVNGGANLLTF